MKFIHTSDWHLGQIFNEYDRSDEHMAFLSWFTGVVFEEKPDAVLISGDVFHNALPSAQSRKMFTDAIVGLKTVCPGMSIVIIAGNHDSGSRLEADRSLWKLNGVTVVGGLSRSGGTAVFDDHIVEIRSLSGAGPAGYVAAVPYVYRQNYPQPDGDDTLDSGQGTSGLDPALMRQKAFYKGLLERISGKNADGLPVVLMAHLAVAGCSMPVFASEGENGVRTDRYDDPLGGMEYVPSDIFPEGYDYLALGHIHHPQTLGMKPAARYCGSPIPLTFNESYPHSISVVDIRPGEKAQIREVEIPCMRSVMTIPSKALPFDEALSVLAGFPEDREAYVRLNVRIRDFLPGDANVKAALSVKGKLCRYCGMRVEREIRSGREAGEVISVEEMKSLDPMDLAEIYYQGKFGAGMPEDLAEMFSEVLSDISDTDRNE